MPPILYPDGKWYLKLGHSKHFEEKIIQNEHALRSWYKSNGNIEASDALANFLSTELIPDLNVLNVKRNCCITTRVSYTIFVQFL